MSDTATRTARTTCNRDCPDACAIVATIEAGRITRLQGDPAHPITRGFLCYRTNQFLSRQYSPERVVTPLLRTDLTQRLRRATWDEALDFIAQRLLRIRAESGPAAIFHYRSGGTLGGLAPLSDYFFERFGPVTTKRGDICSGAGDAAQMLDFGDEDSHDLFDLLNSKHILLWGKNVFVSSPHTIPVLRDAQARGARLTLVDPVFHKTASLCDRFVQPRPGADFALAMGVARRLFDCGRVDPAAASYCDHLDGFRALALAETVAGWAAQADVSSGDIEHLAARLADGPTAILVGWGMGRRRNGAAIVRALDALGAITGNLGVPGGGVSFYFKRRGAFDTSFIRGAAGAPRTVSEPLFGREILAASAPPVRAVWITAGNPVAMLPDSETTARALRSRELVVVADAFQTDTTDCAHVVLPVPTLLEADDLLGAYGHHYLGVAEPVVAPPPEVKSDLQILQALAPRVGLTGVMDGDARAWKQRLIEKRLSPHGLTVESLARTPTRNPLSPRVLFEGRRFATESGRVNLVCEPPPAPASTSAEFPMLLLALSTERAQSSQWAREQDGPAELTVHPESAAGLADGALGRLCSLVGAMTVRVRLDPKQRRDVALMAKGGHLRDGRCANALLRPATTDLGGGGALYDEAVRLEPLGAQA